LSKQPIVKWWNSRTLFQRIGIIVVTLAILGSVSTLTLGGTVKPTTIQQVDGLQHISSINGEPTSGEITGYAENFRGWHISEKSPSVQGQVSNYTDHLVLSGSFQNSSSFAAIDVSKNVNIDIALYPILEVRLNVSRGVGYGIRFFATAPNESIINAWWEGSPLDHRPGIGNETIRVNMPRQVFLATGENISRLTSLQLYVEAPAFSTKNFQLVLSEFDFLNEPLTALVNGNQYRAVYLNFGGVAGDNVSWSLTKVNLGLTITAQPGSVYTIYLVQDALVSAFTTSRNLIYNELVPSNEFTLYPSNNQLLFPEILPPIETSIVIVTQTGFIQSLRVDYVNFLYFPSEPVASELPPGTLGLYYTYFLFFLFLLPLGVAILVFNEFFDSQSIRRKHVASILAVGLLCRVALATTTAHLFDTGIYLASVRDWFQYGTTSGSLGPTLPLTYFLYWIGYSPYAILQLLGFQDLTFFAHQAGMVESFFIKLFPIAMDVLTFLTLSRFTSAGKAFVFASFYFLNPLSIFASSVWGQYEASTVAFIVLGIYWITRDKAVRAGVAFAVSAMIQILGFVPLAMLLIWTGQLGRFKRLLAIGAAPLPFLLYGPQRDLIFRIFLGISGLVRGQFSAPGAYSLLGNLPQLTPLFAVHPLLIAGAGIVLSVSVDAYGKKLNTERIVLYTAVASIALLLLSNLLAAWLWILGLGLAYAIIKKKDDLGAYMLVFGSALTFLIISYHAPAGWAYYFFGPELGAAPAFQAVQNRLLIFSVFATVLGLLFIGYLRYGPGKPIPTLFRTSALILCVYLLLYFWLGAYPL